MLSLCYREPRATSRIEAIEGVQKFLSVVRLEDSITAHLPSSIIDLLWRRVALLLHIGSWWPLTARFKPAVIRFPGSYQLFGEFG